MLSYFKLKEHGTDLKSEFLGGLTTFLTMAYILGVNASILGSAGLTPGSVFFATAISSAVATIFMGIYANAPIALAPGMGLNAFFTYTVVLGSGYTPAEALAMVFVSGLIFLAISVLGLRKLIVDSIPTSLKKSIGAAIGFFIAFIGLNKLGIIIANPATYVTLGSFKNPTVLLGVFGLILTLILMTLEIRSAAFLGLLATAILGIVLGLSGVSGMPTLPNGIISLSFDTSSVGLFLSGLGSILTKPESIVIIFTMLFVDFFDTAGTLIAVIDKIKGLVKNEHPELEVDYNIDKMFYSDALGTVVGATLGTSNVTSFVESSSGVAAGGRTGLSSVIVGILFLLSTLFSPLLSVVDSIAVNDTLFLSPVVAPTLVIVGVLMATQLSNVDWHDFRAAASGFATIIIMVLSYSIANGIAAGFIVYVITNIFSKEKKKLPAIIWVLFVIFLLHFALV